MLGELHRFFKSVPRNYYATIILAALLSVSSLLVNIASDDLFRHIGGDVWVYLVWMRCFSEQFWQGDFYPRWCMDVNGGLGTPLFIFYFPASYYLAALLHPLVVAGLSYYHLFILLCFLASFAAILSCYAWLKDIVDAPYALLVSILFIFMPYRIEMMNFRGAYSEIWCAALVPLFFKYSRHLVRGEGRYILALASITGLSLLTHVPLAAGSLIFCGLYVLLMSGKSWRPKMEFGLAVGVGVMLAAFYIIPAIYYRQDLASNVLAQGLYGWPNNFLTSDLFHMGGLERPLMAAGLTILLLISFSALVLVKRKRIDVTFISREALCFVIIGFASLFMLFPASEPLYALMGPFSKAVFPWRMQMIVTLAITFMLALWMQWFLSAARHKTWKMDLGLTILFVWFLGNFMTSGFSEKGELLNEKIRESKIIFAPEYRTRWTEKDHADYDYLLNRMKIPVPKAEIIEGEGEVVVTSWNWQGIDLKVNSKKPVVVRLNHLYFPVWSGALYKTGVVPLQAEAKTGFMLATIPGGEHLVHLSYDVYKNVPNLIASQWLSMLGCIGLLLAYLKPKFFDRQAIA